MDKLELRAQARAFVRASRALFPPAFEANGRGTRARVPPPLDKARARQACAPMGALVSVVVTVDARKRRRIWYVVDPDPAVSAQYHALGLELSPGCRVLVDAEVMRPVAVLDFDPVASDDAPPSSSGFNPYFDLPAS
ncbi:MAG TPA: hypothetical protein VMV45_14610 [Casimicrobiaceae bacterium]|nr:hypothetical protein [Casimicrobiaceae bacterium]